MTALINSMTSILACMACTEIGGRTYACIHLWVVGHPETIVFCQETVWHQLRSLNRKMPDQQVVAHQKLVSPYQRLIAWQI
jgi:hypothetical protein